MPNHWQVGHPRNALLGAAAAAAYGYGQRFVQRRLDALINAAPETAQATGRYLRRLYEGERDKISYDRREQKSMNRKAIMAPRKQRTKNYKSSRHSLANMSVRYVRMKRRNNRSKRYRRRR